MQCEVGSGDAFVGCVNALRRSAMKISVALEIDPNLDQTSSLLVSLLACPQQLHVLSKLLIILNVCHYADQELETRLF